MGEGVWEGREIAGFVERKGKFRGDSGFKLPADTQQDRGLSKVSLAGNQG